MTTKILAFAGSARQNSINQKLVKVAAQGVSKSGGTATYIDLKDFDIPLFNEDLEAQGTPGDVIKLKNLFREHHGLLIASPEYNSSVTALLKNAIDWVSRPEDGELPLSCFTGKVAGLMAASPGGLGGIRGLVHLRSILGNIGVIVLPHQMAVGRAFEAFGEDGNLVDPKLQESVVGIGEQVTNVATKLQS